MKTIREVCQIAGVTRRILQDYHAIGLLSPSNEAQRKPFEPWLYDENAINRLILIRVLAETGCGRQRIKEILEETNADPALVLQEALRRLEKEQEQIDILMRNIHGLLEEYQKGCQRKKKNKQQKDEDQWMKGSSFAEYLDTNNNYL